MRKRIFALWCCALCFSCSVDASQILRAPTFATTHTIIDYLYEQLQLAIEATQEDFGEMKVVRVKIPVEEERQLRNLNEDIADIAWATCTRERNQDYTPIAVPSIAGLFGIRLAVVRQDDNNITQVNSLPKLQKFVAVQSSKWRDFMVMQRNGITVLASDRFSAYRAVERGLADFYPRGAAEITEEMAIANVPQLTIAPNFALRYPLFFILYVKKGNTALAKRLTAGFERTLQSGEFKALLNEKPWFQEAKQLVHNRVFIDLENYEANADCMKAGQYVPDLLSQSSLNSDRPD
ncbi:MAG: amino acid ABC transporter substrate-binding protein [Aestuariibacter sp.]|nr:amino acid ABC transporter substrate-binding protein [Aestuariibacter sp.]MCP4524398.1 amino acid ABC transporter substrate-binding protein [Aestuariibacter sp.]MCP4946776.1 amino acid ABC transporter substrate-binding protein [Aestuariibacter sp.]